MRLFLIVTFQILGCAKAKKKVRLFWFELFFFSTIIVSNTVEIVVYSNTEI